jgi:hypothetical protein
VTPFAQLLWLFRLENDNYFPGFDSEFGNIIPQPRKTASHFRNGRTASTIGSHSPLHFRESEEKNSLTVYHFSLDFTVTDGRDVHSDRLIGTVLQQMREHHMFGS